MLFSEIKEAKERIYSIAKHTPLVESPELSGRVGSSVYLKLEIAQETGSFKVRGATNKMIGMSKGVVAVSTGNHGRAVAFVGKKLNIPVTVCLSQAVPNNKVDAVKMLGAKAEIIGRSYDEAYDYARTLELACISHRNSRQVRQDVVPDSFTNIREHCPCDKARIFGDKDGVTDCLNCQRGCEKCGLELIHPFDDPKIIAGQGTIGCEILEDLPQVDTVLVPLSGGGLISGIALAIKNERPNVKIIGVSMENGPAMYHSILAGKPVEVEEKNTIADSLKGGIGLDNQHTFSIVRDYVDEIILLSEEEIQKGLEYAQDKMHYYLEGAAAVGIAALLENKVSDLGKNIVIILSGKNRSYL